MERPTLEDQIRANKLTDDEVMEFFKPVGRVEFWIYCHFELLWHIIYWNWFDVWEESENADKYRTWYIKLKRQLFGGNKND